MKVRRKFEKCINFSLISNCVIFNILGKCSGDNKKENGGKGCCGSGKDKDPVVIDNTTPQQQQQEDDKQKPDEQQGPTKEELERKEREDKEKAAAKLAQENAEKLALENKKDGLKTEYKKLKEAFESLNGVVNKFFDISVFKIALTEAEITGCNKTNIDSIEQKLNTDKTNFDNSLQSQFNVLKNKYTEINAKKTDEVFNVEKIENIIKKDKINVDEFIILNSELFSYQQLVENGVEGYRSTILEQYKEKEIYNDKFELAKTIDSTFVNNFNTLYNNVSTLKAFKEIQSNVNTLNDQDTKANKIINDKKTTLNTDITNKKQEYNQLFSDYSLNNLNIKPKKFSGLDSYVLTKVADLTNINNELGELKKEIEDIKGNFVNFFNNEFKKVLEGAKGFELINLIEKFIVVINIAKYNTSRNNIKIFVNTFLGDKFKDNVYFKLTKEGDVIVLIKYNSNVTNFKQKFNLCNTDNMLDDDIKKNYSQFYAFEKFLVKNGSEHEKDKIKIYDYNDILSTDTNKSHILFYVKKGEDYNLFFFESNDKKLTNLLIDKYKNEDGKEITEFNILEISDNVESLNSLFRNYSKITELDVSKINTTNVADMGSMFKDCSSLTKIDLSKFNTNNVKDMDSMFSGCESLTELDLSTFNIDNVINMGSMFNECRKLTKLPFISSWCTPNVSDMACMFSDCNALEELDVSNFDTQHVTNMTFMFSNCKALKKIDVSIFVTTEVIDMSKMFNNCELLEELTLSSFDTKNVTNMKYMFAGCKNLKNLNFSTFNTENVTSIDSMFKNCESIEELDLSTFKTLKVTDMKCMFDGCKALKKINVSNFDTQNVISMANMFNGCKALTELDLSSFNTQNVVSMNYMFNECEALTKIKLTLSKKAVIEYKSMFGKCSNLETIEGSTIDDFEALNKDIFKDCTKLKS